MVAQIKVTSWYLPHENERIQGKDVSTEHVFQISVNVICLPPNRYIYKEYGFETINDVKWQNHPLNIQVLL